MKPLDFEKVESMAFRRGWGLATLQTKAGLANRTLYRIKAGESRGSAATVFKLARALGCDPMELLKA